MTGIVNRGSGCLAVFDSMLVYPSPSLSAALAVRIEFLKDFVIVPYGTGHQPVPRLSAVGKTIFAGKRPGNKQVLRYVMALPIS